MTVEQAVSDISSMPPVTNCVVVQAIWTRFPTCCTELSETQRAELDRRWLSTRQIHQLLLAKKSFENVSARPAVDEGKANAPHCKRPAAWDYWFDRISAGLGEEFEAEFYLALERVKENPEMFAAGHTGYRPCRLKRFTGVCISLLTNRSLWLSAFYQRRR